MVLRYILAFACLVGIALFSALAWKLWQGKGLEFIAGNQFSDKRELDLPYQRRMAKETAVMLVACNLMLAALALCLLLSASSRAILLVMAAFGSVIVAGGLVISLRADRAAKADQADAGRKEQGWPLRGAGPGGGPTTKQWLFVALLYIMMIPFAYLMARLTMG